jgi:hypothetical protein
LAAVYIVPGSLGCSSTVLANIAILAPSFAHALAIAKPIPLEPPVITIVFPLREWFLETNPVFKAYNLFI